MTNKSKFVHFFFFFEEKNSEMMLDVRLGYRNSFDEPWNELVRTQISRHLDCDIDETLVIQIFYSLAN